MRIITAKDLDVALHPTDAQVRFIRVAMEQLMLFDRPSTRGRVGRGAAEPREFLNLGEVGCLEELRVHDHVGSHMEQGVGPNYGKLH